MHVTTPHQNILNLISNTEQITHVDDQFLRHSFTKVYNLESKPATKKTITLRFTHKEIPYKKQIFPFCSLTTNKVRDDFAINLITLMIKNNEYKYYFNLNPDYFESLSIDQLEQKFKSIWATLESKLNSHYDL